MLYSENVLNCTEGLRDGLCSEHVPQLRVLTKNVSFLVRIIIFHIGSNIIIQNTIALC